MEYIAWFFDVFMHLDTHLNLLVQDFGIWTYLVLFLIIFCETGLVVTPLLPGDSLLFAIGNFAALGSLRYSVLLVGLSVAAILGDTVNYGVGHFMGPRVFQQTNSRIFKKEYIEKTHRFYEKYGGKTIIFARFVPIVRTFAPFVAGIGSMSYGKFIVFNIVGGVSWIALFLTGGYLFGNIPVVKRNFTIVIFAIIFVSILPGMIEFIRHRRRA
ncbi:MAG: DedA family protein [Thermodesulfobacteriota bacterium]